MGMVGSALDPSLLRVARECQPKNTASHNKPRSYLTHTLIRRDRVR